MPQLHPKILEDLVQRVEGLQEKRPREHVAAMLAAWNERFPRDRLAALSGEELLLELHARNRDSLAYWVEHKVDETFQTGWFGGIRGGSALKFVVYQAREDDLWRTGSSRDVRTITAAEAAAVAERQRDELLVASEVVEGLGVQHGWDELEQRLSVAAPEFGRLAFFHKTLSVWFPTKLDDFHALPWQTHALVSNGLDAATTSLWANAGTFVTCLAELREAVGEQLPMTWLSHAMWERAGALNRTWRVGTRTDTYDAWPDMQASNEVAVGWTELGDLTEIVGDSGGRETVAKLKAALEERNPEEAATTRGKSARQLKKFLVDMKEGDLVIAAHGLTVRAIGHVDGAYRYRAGEGFGHRRSVVWDDVGEWRSPTKAGLRTTVHNLDGDVVVRQAIAVRLAERATVELRLVQTPEEVIDSVRNFGAVSQEERARVAARKYFVYDTLSGWVAPAKFAGLEGMTVARYQAVATTPPVPSVFDGARTRQALEQLDLPEGTAPAVAALGAWAAERAHSLPDDARVFVVGPNPDAPSPLQQAVTALPGMRRYVDEDGQAPHKPLMLLSAIELTAAGRALSYAALREGFEQMAAQLGWPRMRPYYPFGGLVDDGPDGLFWTLADAQGNVPQTHRFRSHGDAAPYHATWPSGLAACLEDARLRDHLREAVLAQLAPDQAAILGGHRAQTTDPEPIVEDPVERDLAAICGRFTEAVDATGLTFGEDGADFVRAFLASNLTKRFVILTGLSGSGKTQIAKKLGDWFGPTRSRLIPVRPDWTGAEALFGYEDVLQQAIAGRRPWHVPPALAFMLRAHRDPRHPYLLILDEMNLAHVERYFADVLSGMESGDGCLPELVQEDGRWVAPPGGEPVPFPSNLFVVGTVNVDETTYMFSPKVLDRANTIEFRVSTGDLERQPLLGGRPRAAAAGAAADLRGVLEVATTSSWAEGQRPGWLPEFASELRKLHALLSTAGFEFGYRTYAEATRFACIHHAMGAQTLESSLDLQVVQKVLPRLHGARRRLEPVLCAVARFAFDGEVSGDEVFDPEKVAGAARLPRSFDKLLRMTVKVRANQFASFAE